MARSSVFIFRLPLAVFLSRNVKFPALKNWCASFHSQGLSRQYESSGGEKTSESHETKSEESQLHEEVDIEDLKIKILNASLKFVPEHGWSEKSIALGAKSLGISSASHTLVEGGGSDLVHYFNYFCNNQLEDYLKDISSSGVKVDLREFLIDALENRLRLVIPYLPKWPEAMALMALPTQIPTHTKNILDLVDSIWHHYGDTSLDMSWYRRRIVLAFAYKTSELSLIQDKSEDFSDTFEFLQKRVDNVIGCNTAADAVAENGKQLLEFGSGAFITARNLLGLNRWFR